MKHKTKNKIICPECKAEIDCLDCDVTTTCSAQLYAGKKLDYDLDCLLGNVEFDNFRCPECSAIIGEGTYSSGRKFLGDENGI